MRSSQTTRLRFVHGRGTNPRYLHEIVNGRSTNGSMSGIPCSWLRGRQSGLSLRDRGGLFSIFNHTSPQDSRSRQYQITRSRAGVPDDLLSHRTRGQGDLPFLSLTAFPVSGANFSPWGPRDQRYLWLHLAGIRLWFWTQRSAVLSYLKSSGTCASEYAPSFQRKRQWGNGSEVMVCMPRWRTLHESERAPHQRTLCLDIGTLDPCSAARGCK